MLTSPSLEVCKFAYANQQQLESNANECTFNVHKFVRFLIQMYVPGKYVKLPNKAETSAKSCIFKVHDFVWNSIHIHALWKCMNFHLALSRRCLGRNSAN